MNKSGEHNRIPYLANYLNENGIQAIEELGIRVKYYPYEGIYVFNYSQIDSPKTHPVVRDSRGTIMKFYGPHTGWKYIARTFERFFNYGEAPEVLDNFIFSRSSVMEKADGSMIKMWFCPDRERWFIGTRGTAYAEAENQEGKSFFDMVVDCFGNIFDFEDWASFNLDKNETHIFEFISPYNRIVTPYSKSELVYLGSVNNEYGSLTLHEDISDTSPYKCIRHAKTYDTSSIEACVDASKSLPDLEEGYVVRDLVSGQMVKIKSPTYVAAHHARGDYGLTPKTCRELVVTNEIDEYLKYFPDDEQKLEPYINAWEVLECGIAIDYSDFSDIVDQKDFASKVKHLIYSGVLFKARSHKKDPVLVLHDQPKKYKMQLLEKTMEIMK